MQQVTSTHVRTVRIAAALLTLVLSLLLFAPTSLAQEITATLRIEFIEDTRLAPKEVTLEHRPLSEYGFTLNDPGFITPFHVLAEGLEQAYGPGAAAQRIGMFGSLLGTIDGSFGSIAGEPNVWWMFAVNQSMPVAADTGWGYAMNQYRVADGDDIDFLGMWGGQWGVASPYLGFFHSQTYQAVIDQSLEVQLIGLDGFDDFGIPPARGLEGAEILVDRVDGTRVGATTPSGSITDARGVAELTFDEAGTYLLSAKRPIASSSSPSGTVSDITRPFAIVTVTEGGGSGGNDTGGNDGTGTNPPILDLPQWDSSRGNSHNSGITTAQTPGTTQSGQALWSHRVSDGLDALSPVKIGDYLYIAAGSTLFKFNAAAQTGTGAARLVTSAQLAQPTGQAAFLAAGSGKVFVPIDGGRVQAFDAASLESLWTSDLLDAGWQTWGALSYQDGYLYGAAGRDRFAVESDGAFFCLNAETGEGVWTYSSTSTQRERGFYWSGAAHISTTTGDAVLFAGDDGVLVSHRAGSAGDSADGVIDTVALPDGVRGSVLFVPAAGGADGNNSRAATGGSAYVTTRDGHIARVTVAADGSFVGAALVASLSGETSTSTPVAYRNRIYAVSGELQNHLGEPGNGYVDVFDATSLQRLRSVQLPGFSQSSPLLSTAAANAANGFEVSLFVALNGVRDDLVRIVDSENSGQQQIRAESFFRPGGSFTLSSVSACENGTLYYTDGRGYFTAVAASNAPLPANDESPQNDNGSNDSGRNDSGSNDSGNNDSSRNDNYNPLTGGNNRNTGNNNRNAGNTGSTTTTGTANTGPKTGDETDFTPYLIAAVLAALIILAIMAKLIVDSRKKKAAKTQKDAAETVESDKESEASPSDDNSQTSDKEGVQ